MEILQSRLATATSRPPARDIRDTVNPPRGFDQSAMLPSYRVWDNKVIQCLLSFHIVYFSGFWPLLASWWLYAFQENRFQGILGFDDINIWNFCARFQIRNLILKWILNQVNHLLLFIYLSTTWIFHPKSSSYIRWIQILSGNCPGEIINTKICNHEFRPFSVPNTEYNNVIWEIYTLILFGLCKEV